MTALTPFDIEFFALSRLLKNTITEESKQSLLRVLLKLNNPTYFNKFVKKHPIEWHGFTSSKTINPVIIAISNMIALLKIENNPNKLLQALQTEFAWAFNNITKYSSINL
jgi:hypothetical protein